MLRTDLFALISRDTPLKRTSATRGGEYSAPCPLDCYQGRLSGRDHFKVWESAGGGEGRWACLGPKAGRSGCDKGGDAIQYLRERDGLTYRAACEQLGLNPNNGANGRGMRSGGEGAGTDAVVATGSTGGGRRSPWVAGLALAPVVLVAFDADRAGDGAAQWWLDVLPRARRWRPLLHDVNSLPDPEDVRAWVMQGLDRFPRDGVRTRQPIR